MKIKKLIPLFLIIFTFAIIIAFCFAPVSFREAIFSKIPLIKKIVNVTFQSSTNIISESSVLKLKTAQFDLDFLMELENQEGKFIALYPYRVVAGVDLTKQKIEKKENNSVYIKLKSPQIIFSGMSNSKDALVVYDTLKNSANDYDAYFKSAKIAFEKKVKDLAFENNIIEKCQDNAKKVLQNLYSAYTDNININFEENKEDNIYDEQNAFFSNRENVGFVFSNESHIKAMNTIMPNRDDMILSINETDFARFGFFKSLPQTETYSSFAKKYFSKTSNENIMMQVSFPFQKTNMKKFFFANSSGYNYCRIMTNDGKDFYLQTLPTTVENHKENYSPNLIYAALCFDINEKSLSHEKNNEKENYLLYANYHDVALSSFKNKYYSAVENVLLLQKEKFGLEKNLEKLFSINSLLYHKKFIPVNNEPKFNLQLEIASILLSNKLSNFDYNARKKLLDAFSTETETRVALKANFLQNADSLNLTDKEFLEYTDDIVQTGLIISKELFKVLPKKDMQKYLTNILQKKLIVEKEGFPFVHKVDKTVYVFCDDKSKDFFEKDNHGHLWFINIFNKRSATKNIYDENILNDKVVLIYLKKGFWIEYSAIIFNSESLMIYDNFSSWIINKDAAEIFYKDILDNGESIMLGNFQYNNKIALPVLKEMHYVFSKENYHGINLSNNFINDLSQKLIFEMQR